jgi:hypothetical protein
MNINLKFFEEKYPQFSTLEDFIKSDISNDYVISDYNGSYSKDGKDTFVNFAISLMKFANSNSVRSIKQIFDDKDFVNELDSSGFTLYVLAFAKYNGKKFTVKANSTNKYNTDNYIVLIENE